MGYVADEHRLDSCMLSADQRDSDLNANKVWIPEHFHDSLGGLTSREQQLWCFFLLRGLMTRLTIHESTWTNTITTTQATLACGCFARATLVFQTLPSCLGMRSLHLLLLLWFQRGSRSQNRKLDRWRFSLRTDVVADRRREKLLQHSNSVIVAIV